MYEYKDVYQYSKNLNILYVEDDEATAEASVDIFESFFLNVKTATDGEEGLDKYIRHKEETSQFYDLVITDINMPKKTGLEMIRDIRSIHDKQEIIVISAYNDSNRLMELIREGISNFITKPIMPRQLIQILYKTTQNIFSEKMQNEFIIEQAKLASMGQMIDTIAHQWLGPINLMKMQLEMLEMDIVEGVVDKDEIKECVLKQSLQINHIIETLGEFRTFFRPSNELVIIRCEDIINSSLILLKDRLLKNIVNVSIAIEENITIKVIPNEFKHVILNIINNSLDEFTKTKIENPAISINGYKREDAVVLEFLDNAGGIPENIIDRIFEANFTTKVGGTGVGLRLVVIILDKLNAKISVKNIAKGSKFEIELQNI